MLMVVSCVCPFSVGSRRVATIFVFWVLIDALARGELLKTAFFNVQHHGQAQRPNTWCKKEKRNVQRRNRKSRKKPGEESERWNDRLTVKGRWERNNKGKLEKCRKRRKDLPIWSNRRALLNTFGVLWPTKSRLCGRLSSDLLYLQFLVYIWTRSSIFIFNANIWK